MGLLTFADEFLFEPPERICERGPGPFEVELTFDGESWLKGKPGTVGSPSNQNLPKLRLHHPPEAGDQDSA
jgi:hypothetical protein